MVRRKTLKRNCVDLSYLTKSSNHKCQENVSNMIWAFGEAALASGGGGAGPLGGAGTLIFASASCQVRKTFNARLFCVRIFTRQSRKPDISDHATFKVLSFECYQCVFLDLTAA